MMTLAEGKGSWQTTALGKGQGKCETHATSMATATTSMTITKKAARKYKKKETQTKTKMKRNETKTHPDSSRVVSRLVSHSPFASAEICEHMATLVCAQQRRVHSHTHTQAGAHKHL